MEIRRAVGELEPRVKHGAVDIIPLHGSLDAGAQDAALRRSSSRRCVIVATNIAETSVTVPGVRAVVDSGWCKVARYDAERAIDSLDLERITADSADRRAGRAGRLAPGIVWRLWDSRDRLRPRGEPDIHRVDLSATVLAVVAWGGDPRAFEWFERPRDEALDAAMGLLHRLGALRDGKLTGLGDQIRRLPIHPRLARMLIETGGAREIAQACALLSERHFVPSRLSSTTSDLLSAIDDWRTMPSHVQRVAREIEDLGSEGVFDRRRHENPSRPHLPEAEFRKAVLAGYPDRVAQRREATSPRVRLASGAGAILGPESGVREGEFLVALDVQAPRSISQPVVAQALRPAKAVRPAQAVPNDARIRLASRVEREWLQPNRSDIVHRFDPEAGVVRASKVDRYDALILAEHPTKPDGAIAADLLADAWMARGPKADDEQLLRRLEFAGRTLNVDDLVRVAARGARSLDEVHLARGLARDVRRALDRDAPESIAVPSGRMVRLEYAAEGGVSAAVKLQEVFGLAETPRLGPGRMPLLFSLLAPDGRSIQLTRDLRSFWDRTYPEVRRELRGRYPRHPWPEDPWTAKPSARTKPR
jgi:ATP-dependent helicase HrpB